MQIFFKITPFWNYMKKIFGPLKAVLNHFRPIIDFGDLPVIEKNIFDNVSELIKKLLSYFKLCLSIFKLLLTSETFPII